MSGARAMAGIIESESLTMDKTTKEPGFFEFANRSDSANERNTTPTEATVASKGNRADYVRKALMGYFERNRGKRRGQRKT